MKDGKKTSEFWLLTAATVLAVVGAALGELKAEWAVSVSATLASLYAVLRFILKLKGEGVAVQEIDKLKEQTSSETDFILAPKKRAEVVEIEDKTKP